MSDNIPLDIQREIIKWLPLKPLLQFRSVSKAWKSLIDSSKFINDYHIIRNHPQRLLLQYDIYSGFKFISVIDDDTFPHNTSFVPVPESIKRLRNPLRVVGWSNGLFCLHGYFPKKGVDTQRVVLWNPFLKKTVDIVIPYGSDKTFEFVINSVVGFGVCPETSDVKLVMIDSSIPIHWVVKVFSLSSRAWTSLYVDPLFKSFELKWDQVSINGFIYFLGYGDVGLDHGIRSNLIVSFDLKSETLGHVHLPDILLHTQCLRLSKRNECLTVLEKLQTGIGVWMMKDGLTKSFTKMFALKSCSPLSCMDVKGFRKNGKAIIVTIVFDEDIQPVSLLQVYDPCSGDFNDIGFGEIQAPSSASSYMDTLLLLDQSDSIIH